MAESQDQNYAGVWDSRLGFGNKTALIVIDLLQGYTTEGAPLYAPGVVSAVSEMHELLAAARAAGMMIIHTNVRYNEHTFADGGIWTQKAPVLKCLVENDPLAQFCEGMEPQPEELLITKNYASAFFGTSLSSTLTAAGVDTLMITGCTTSGCIRATAVDCLQYGFRPIAVSECCGDRHDGPHEANLFDINAKYGDVISKAEALEYVATLS